MTTDTEPILTLINDTLGLTAGIKVFRLPNCPPDAVGIHYVGPRNSVEITLANEFDFQLGLGEGELCGS
jgi:hypothetical protein